MLVQGQMTVSEDTEGRMPRMAKGPETQVLEN